MTVTRHVKVFRSDSFAVLWKQDRLHFLILLNSKKELWTEEAGIFFSMNNLVSRTFHNIKT